LLLPDVRLHNKKYSRFYFITDTRKRKVMNVKKHKKYNGIQLRYKGYMASRQIQKEITWLRVWWKQAVGQFGRAHLARQC